MGTANVSRYLLIEKTIRKVGKENLRAYVAQKGWRMNHFDRDIDAIKYCLQHGPISTSQVFHLSQSYPSLLLRKYYEAALELSKIMESGGDNERI